MSAQRQTLMFELVLVMEAFDYMEIDVNDEGVINIKDMIGKIDVIQLSLSLSLSLSD
jgi:hypothetical protein